MEVLWRSRTYRSFPCQKKGPACGSPSRVLVEQCRWRDHSVHPNSTFLSRRSVSPLRAVVPPGWPPRPDPGPDKLETRAVGREHPAPLRRVERIQPAPDVDAPLTRWGQRFPGPGITRRAFPDPAPRSAGPVRPGRPRVHPAALVSMPRPARPRPLHN